MKNIKTVEDIFIWIDKNITIKEEDKNVYSVKDILRKKSGNSHSIANLTVDLLSSINIKGNKLVIIDYDDITSINSLDNNETDTETSTRSPFIHTIVYYKYNNKIYWIENVWGEAKGINGPFNNEEDMYDNIRRLYYHIYYTIYNIAFIKIDNKINKSISLDNYVKEAINVSNIKNKRALLETAKVINTTVISHNLNKSPNALAQFNRDRGKNYTSVSIAGSKPNTIQGEDAYDTILKTFPEYLNIKELEELSESVEFLSDKVVEIYKSIVIKNIDSLQLEFNNKINELKRRGYNINDTVSEYPGVIAWIKKDIHELFRCGLSGNNIADYLLRDYFPPEINDPDSVRTMINMRLKYNTALVESLKIMLKLNYTVLNIKEKESEELVNELISDQSSGIRNIRQLIKNNSNKFIKGNLIDFRIIGGGIIYGTDNFKGLEKYVKPERLFIQSLTYDAIVYCHGSTDGRDWTNQPVRTMSGKTFYIVADLLEELINVDHHKNILLLNCNPGGYYFTQSFLDSFPDDVTITFSKTEVISESVNILETYTTVDYPEDILETEQFLEAFCNENYIDYNNTELLKESYDYLYANINIIEEGKFLNIIKELAKKILKAIVYIWKKMIEFFKYIYAKIVGFFKRIRNSKASLKTEKPTKASYITLESAQVKDIKFQDMTEFKKRLEKSCNSISKEIKKKTNEQVNLTNKLLRDINSGKIDILESFNIHLEMENDDNISWLYEYYKDLNCNSIKELEEKITQAKEYNSTTIGRVVIYPIKDLCELESLYFKYRALYDEESTASDDKSKELFGKTNEELYMFIKNRLLENDSDTKEEYSITNKEAEKKSKYSSSLFTNDLPMLTPKELTEKLSEDFSIVESENATLNKWLQEYILLGQGIKTEDYNMLNLERINILRKAIYENDEETIIRCGWIPGVEFNSKNRVKASNIVREKMEVSNIIDYDMIEEASNSKDKKAVSIVFVAGSSILAKSIRKVQGTEFSHASIALDDDLSKIYSFNMRNGFNGLTYESVKNYIKEGVTKMGVYTFLVSDKIYNDLEKALEKFNLYIDKTKYSILNLLTIPINIPLDMDMRMVCSEFVDKLLKMANLDLTNKKSSLVGPKDLIKATGTKSNIVEVFNGDPKKFNHKEIEKKIKKIKRSNLPIYEFVEYDNEVITEAKSLPIQFDKDGNLILKNLRKINFEQEYYNSHRLLIEYDKTKSYEPMKFELAKMQFFITLLEKKIFKEGKDKSVTELKVRARFLNDFKKYLKIINNIDPSFNFTEYYEQSPFNDALIKIDKDTLKYGFKALKYIVKG